MKKKNKQTSKKVNFTSIYNDSTSSVHGGKDTTFDISKRKYVKKKKKC